jgi:hypothetical protein
LHMRFDGSDTALMMYVCLSDHRRAQADQ